MEFNWISIIIAALAAIVLYMVKKTMSLRNTIAKLEEELEVAKLANIQYIESTNKPGRQQTQVSTQALTQQASRPATQQRNNPIPLKNINMQKPTVQSVNKVTSPEKAKQEETDSESYTDSESEYEDDTASYTSSETSETSMSDDYISNTNEIEKYGNDKKEMIIPININSLLQGAIEEHMNKDTADTNVKVSEVVEEDEKKDIEEDRVSDMFRNTVETEEANAVKESESQPEKQTENTMSSADKLRQDLNAKNIIAIKNMAKELDIKITEGGRPKNKETLISEIISKTYQNI